MGVTVDWLNQEFGVVQLRFQAEWSWQDLLSAAYEGYQMKAYCNKAGALVLDVRDVRGYKLGTIAYTRKLLCCNAQRFEKIIYIGATFEYQSLISMAARVVENQYTLPEIHFLDHPHDIDKLYTFSEV